MQEESTRVSWFCLSCSLMLISRCPAAVGAGAVSAEHVQGDSESGSGSFNLQDHHSFPADSLFVAETPGEPVNCSLRFWLPTVSPVCRDDVALPGEVEESRRLVLQNRAALQAVFQASEAAAEGGTSASFNQQALENLQAVRADYLNVTRTTETIEKEFLALEKRREGEEHRAFSSIREHVAMTKHSINRRDHLAGLLENQFSSLENSLQVIQLRLQKLMAH